MQKNDRFFSFIRHAVSLVLSAGFPPLFLISGRGSSGPGNGQKNIHNFNDLLYHELVIIKTLKALKNKDYQGGNVVVLSREKP
ncbi:MAG: hypothetical protein IIY39_01445, partial [Firmicutes bacterium]|nr:hypothetical protein [Bacillota bacterium]